MILYKTLAIIFSSSGSSFFTPKHLVPISISSQSFRGYPTELPKSSSSEFNNKLNTVPLKQIKPSHILMALATAFSLIKRPYLSKYPFIPRFNQHNSHMFYKIRLIQQKLNSPVFKRLSELSKSPKLFNEKYTQFNKSIDNEYHQLSSKQFQPSYNILNSILTKLENFHSFYERNTHVTNCRPLIRFFYESSRRLQENQVDA